MPSLIWTCSYCGITEEDKEFREWEGRPFHELCFQDLLESVLDLTEEPLDKEQGSRLEFNHGKDQDY